MLDANKSRFVDFQKIRIQETQAELPRGAIPRTLVQNYLFQIGCYVDWRTGIRNDLLLQLPCTCKKFKLLLQRLF